MLVTATECEEVDIMSELPKRLVVQMKFACKSTGLTGYAIM